MKKEPSQEPSDSDSRHEPRDNPHGNSKDDAGRRHPDSQREYLGVMFECCSVYSHIHKSNDGAAYVGWCPRCAKKVTVSIGPSGTSSRFFKVY